MQRIVAHLHVQLGNRAPGAADGVEGAAGDVLQNLRALHVAADMAARLDDRSFGMFRQPDAAERQGDALADLSAGDIDKFERTAAEVADDAVGVVIAADDAERGEIGFLLAGQHAHLLTEDDLGPADEIRTVRCVARCSGRQHENSRGARLRGQAP